MFGTRLTLALSLLLYFTDIHGNPVVDVYPGEIHGTTFTTRNGRNISAFLGIPYAEPPVGPRRFKPPQIRSLWYNPDNENLNDKVGKVDGNRCPQLNDDGEVVGDEDCLYLNIFTPDILPDKPFPTMVYFHGGGFVRGSGSSTEAGPEYLLDRDVILVTVNYRLGALGFLSTGDEVAPGNFGLKDQAAALEWIQRYIFSFGGAAEPVTIFGQDAGGVSASLHAVSDQSKDSFTRYISQSGNAVSMWGTQDKFDYYYDRATDLGKHLDCPTHNSRVLVNCLRNVDVKRLVDSNDIFKNNAIWPWLNTTWAPTIERGEVEDPFLKDYALHRIVGNYIKPCPAIVGNVRDEGLLITAGFYADDDLYNKVAKNRTAFLRWVVNRLFSSHPISNPSKFVEDYYFHDVSPTDKELFLRNLTQLATDMEFRYPTSLFVSVIPKPEENPVYVYTFDYRGTFSKTSATIGNNHDFGIAHGDELLYLFPMKTADIELSKSDQKMINIMVDFWTSFATTGIPTSQSLADPDAWKPSDPKEQLSLHIGYNAEPTNMEYRLEYDENVIQWDMTTWRELAAVMSLS